VSATPISGLTPLLPAAVPPPALDEARIGDCVYPHFPWNVWERWAVASGLAPDLAGLGGLVVREAYNHGWLERLCALAGWRDDGRELLGLALRSPEVARRHWEILLRTEGLRGDIPPGSTDWTWEYLRPDAETLRAELESQL
jgi:hypothetical protein